MKLTDLIPLEKKESLLLRFMSKVNISGNCWMWQAALDKQGYGKLIITGRPIYAHRLSYLLYKGDLIAGLEIDHLCKQKACVNPKHLEQVTKNENIRRAYFVDNTRNMSVINGQKTSCGVCGGQYTTVTERVGGVKRSHRICKFCIKVRQLKKNPTVFGNPKQAAINIQKFMAVLDSPSTTTDQYINLVERITVSFGASGKSALKLILAMRGINTYSNKVAQAVKYIHKLENEKNVDLLELAKTYDLTIANTRLRLKPDDPLVTPPE